MSDSRSTISPSWPTRWPSNAFTGFGTWILAAALALGVFFVFAANVRQGSQSLAGINPAVLVTLLGIQLVFEAVIVAIVLAALPGMSKFSLRELGFRVPTLGNVGTAVAGALAMAIVANGTASLIDALAHSNHQQTVVQLFKGLHGTGLIATFVLFAAVLAPIAEETVFRLFFFNLGLRFGGFWGGAALSGVLFGLAHGDLYAAFPLALGGVVLCFIYYRTRNAYASMIAHGLFNGVTIVALLVAPNAVS